MTARRRARAQALQVLCLLDTQPDLSPAVGMALYRQHLSHQADAAPDQAEEEDEGAAGGLSRFAEELIRGVRENLSRVDELIRKASRNWRLERMTWVDRNILRIAAYELALCPEVPVRVAINEAIELAKRFGTTESASFVNGVLDRLMSDVGRAAG